MNPHALRHVILSHACLPVPALPQAAIITAAEGAFAELACFNPLPTLPLHRFTLPLESRGRGREVHSRGKGAALPPPSPSDLIP